MDMDFPLHFICAGPEYSTLTDYVPAPYLRKSFSLDTLPDTAELLICGLGFYELFLNGKRITRGLLSPFISNPDDLLYYDRYDLLPYLRTGENVLGLCLGNGFQNNPGGYCWSFDKARWRAAPEVALRLEMKAADAVTVLESDETFKTAPSPIYNDDYRNGEYYDARREIPGWCDPGFDDSGWKAAQKAPVPRGEAVLCQTPPIGVVKEVAAVSVTPFDGGYLYDFGENGAGVCRLTIRGERGQTISLYHGEIIKDGKMDRESISFDENDYVQKDIYICKGEGVETYTPSFTYHGFQYVHVKGLKPEQATKELLTYVMMNTLLPERGNFSCSDPIVNALQAMTRRSTLSNFHHFPTDCPQREKNGWTGDASLSVEHTLLNLQPDENYREWMRAIRKAQAENGAIPAIIPTGGWGFVTYCGPAWDNVLIYIPYMTYLYRHDKTILQENAHAIFAYLDHLSSHIREDGLICWGLGDWCPVGRFAHHFKAPNELTDTILSMDMCEKAAFIFGELGMSAQKAFAEQLYRQIRAAARERLLDLQTMTAAGNCQTSQAMAIFYSLFEPGEKPEAFRRLLEFIHAYDDHMDVGILGGRVIFHVLADFGECNLAYRMITRTDFPGYGEWVGRPGGTLREHFLTTDKYSTNHHFWGDISHWFIRQLAGICYNPHRRGSEADIRPHFVEALRFADGWHMAPEGKIAVHWERDGAGLRLDIEVPQALSGRIVLPKSYVFAEDGLAEKPLAAGSYAVARLEDYRKEAKPWA